MNIIERIKNCGIVPVVRLDDPNKAVPLAEALIHGGINVMEVTLGQKGSLDVIRRIRIEMPQMLIGAGTVLRLDQLTAAFEAGASFISSPGLSVGIAEAADMKRLPYLPGVVTPGEISLGFELGMRAFKFFPAECFGGINTLKALATSFVNAKFIPQGGINEKNVVDYWTHPNVHAVGGSWVAPEKLIEKGDFDGISKLADKAVELMWLSKN